MMREVRTLSTEIEEINLLNQICYEKNIALLLTGFEFVNMMTFTKYHAHAVLLTRCCSGKWIY